MKPIVFIILIFGAQYSFADDPTTRGQRLSMLSTIDDWCGDDWCEGHFEYDFKKLRCEDSSMTCRVDYLLLGSKGLRLPCFCILKVKTFGDNFVEDNLFSFLEQMDPCAEANEAQMWQLEKQVTESN
ncbi:MAG TPA: hypothetical protein PLJ21_02235 [Pseudobdellovibrionaceae bacterium]|nr:hypothetical protein [Pseudobdellovibrionaceae bacterium]